MNSRAPISYRPSMERSELEKVVTKKLRYKALNRFIDEAVREKITRELAGTEQSEMGKLLRKLTEVVYEHNGWKMMKLTPEIIDRIEKRAKPVEEGKVRSYPWKAKSHRVKPAVGQG